MRNSVIIVAGGSGTRMGTALPKQFLEIDGKALVLYTIEKFLEFDPAIEIILVLNEVYWMTWQKIRNDSGFNYPVKIAPGGKTRFHSVKSGISMLEGETIVGIHDSVRPLVSVSTLQRVYETASQEGCAIPYIPLKESVRQVSNGLSRPLDRSGILIIQTPQVFQSEILKRAYQTKYNESFTDDAMVVEKAGYEIKLVPGDEYNLKITTPGDFELARILLTRQKPLPQ